jgi:acyl-CoA thioester hydrolase
VKYLDRTVNYYETDQMAIVHHSNYIRYFEEGRVSFMEQVGYPYERLEREEVISPVLSISCKYLRPVRFGDRIRIAVKLVSVTKVKCTFSYEITDLESGEIRARGTSLHGFITRDGRPVILPKDKPEFYETFMGELEPEAEEND